MLHKPTTLWFVPTLEKEQFILVTDVFWLQDHAGETKTLVTTSRIGEALCIGVGDGHGCNVLMI